MVAEDDVLHGRPGDAEDTVDELADEDDPQPPWVKPWSRLLRAHLLDLDGQRARAVVEYKVVLHSPHGLADLRERAEDGVRRPFRRRGSSNNIK
jgi:hypothetical protein